MNAAIENMDAGIMHAALDQHIAIAKRRLSSPVYKRRFIELARDNGLAAALRSLADEIEAKELECVA